MGSALLRRQLELLKDAPSFRLLFFATLGSGLGTMLAVIALMVDVFDRTRSGTWVAALLIADFLPMLVIGLLLGPLVDRFSRRRLMIVSDLVRCAAFVALPFAPNAATIVVLAGVVGFASGFFRPAVYAGLPNLVRERDLPQANSLFQAVENLTWLVGPLLGGVLLSAAGPTVPYAVNAVTFLVSAALLARIPARDLAAADAASSGGHWRDLAEGFGVVRRSRPLVAVLVAWTIVMFANAGVNVAEVALVKVVFDARDVHLGAMMATAGAGLVLGSVLAGAWAERIRVAWLYGGALLLMAAGTGAAAAAPSVWVAMALVVVSGFGNGVAGVLNPLLVQRGAPDRVRGRAFTVIMSVNFAALGLGMILAGRLTDSLGARWVWAAAAVTYAVAAAVAVALARGVDVRDAAAAETEEPPDELAIVATAAPQARSGPDPL
ncbi:MAG TPA: MFS transporter [Gaiellaceae bacterium]|nr:MFS transporter [Gaiellaceae bacterium]